MEKNDVKGFVVKALDSTEDFLAKYTHLVGIAIVGFTTWIVNRAERRQRKG